MPADEAQTEILTHTIDILRVAAHLRADAIKELEKLEVALQAEITNKGDLTVNKAARTEALLQQTQQQIAEAYKLIGDTQVKGLKGLARLEAPQAAKVINAQIGASVVTTAIAPKLLEAVVDAPIIFGHSAAAWWKAQAEDLRFKFAGEMRQGILRGETVDELARRVRGTKAKEYTDGIMPTKKREAEALVRSSAISVSNEARLRSFQEMDDIVKGIAWLATLDTRTTPICRALDGLQWTLKYEPVGHNKAFPGATAHWNCRSTQITVLKSWDELAGKKLPSLDDQEIQSAMEEELAAMGWDAEKIGKAKANARASMDGQVPRSMNFQDWMVSKGDAFIERILGPGRAALFKAGKVSIRDLTSQENRPLTLQQLENKILRGIPAPETLGVEFPMSAPAAPYEPYDPVPLPAKELPSFTATTLKKKADKFKAADELKASLTPEQLASHNAGEMDSAILSQGKVTILRDAAGKIVAAIATREDDMTNAREVLHVGSLAKGAGTAALKIAAEESAAAGGGLVLFSHPDAKGFYLKLGFEEDPNVPNLMRLSAAKTAELAKPTAPTKQSIEEAPAAPAPKGPTAEELAATAELSTQVASKTWGDMAKKVLAEMAGQSPVAQLAVFNEKKIQKQQATMLNDTAAMNVAKGWMPPVTKTMLNKLADDDPAKIAFYDKVALAKAKLDSEQQEKIAIAKQAALDEAAQKAIDSFAAKSPMHAAAVDFVKGLFSGPDALTEIAQAMHGQLDFEANQKLQQTAEGGKGVSLIAKAKAKQLLKANPDAGYDDLIKVEATVAESIASAGKTAAINGAVKNTIAGKKLNAKQQAAVDAMTPEEKAEFDSKVAAGKASPAVKAEAEIATAPDVHVQNLTQELPAIGNLKYIKSLPGSTNPGLWEDTTTGKQWVIKNSSETSAEHVESEALADAIYRAAGARVPFSAVVPFGTGTSKIAEFIPNGKQLASAATPENFAEARRHFVLDALMGNWDAVGTGKNNMLIDAAGNLWRIDNGGALAWRAMGEPKDKKWLTAEVQELQTLMNPALNSDAAAVYKGITTDEIHQQITDILTRKDAILRAAASDPAMRDLLEARIGYLEKMLPAAKKPAPKPMPANPVIPANITALVSKARTAGVNLDFGGMQVEDNNAIVWQERNGAATDIRMQLKVTPAGSAAIEAKLRAAGVNIAATTATATGAITSDPIWDKIEPMAKHIGFHAGKGSINPMKVGDLKPLRGEMQVLAKSKDPTEAAKGAYYVQVLNDLIDAKIVNAKPSKKWLSWNDLVDTDPAYAKYKPKPAAKKDGADEVLAGWTIKRLDKWDTYLTEVLHKDGIRTRTSRPGEPLDVVTGYELTKGSVTVRFAPQRNVSEGNAARIMMGAVQVWVNGTQIDSGTAQAMRALEELGIDTTPATNAQREIQYLHKGWYQHNRHTKAAYRAIYESTTLSDEEKADQMRALSEKEFNVKLPKTPAEWNADYDPRGFNDASDGTGYRVYYRWDIPRSKMEKEMSDYNLNHSTSHLLEAIEGFLSAGRVTPTYDRLRIGVNTQHGLSAYRDIRTGGAMYFFNSVTRKKAGIEGGNIRWKIRNLARLDAVSINDDVYGSFDSFYRRVTSIDDYKQMIEPTGNDQALLKNGMSFVDEVEAIYANSHRQQEQIIALFKAAGYAKLPDGRKIETVVTVQ